MLYCKCKVSSTAEYYYGVVCRHCKSEIKYGCHNTDGKCCRCEELLNHSDGKMVTPSGHILCSHCVVQNAR